MTSFSSEKGFTLVELAIALMVIGLLIGGVLKGQELIENARITATMRQIKAYDTATLIFRNTYNALPGDIKRPNRIPNCTEEICNLGGNGNGKIRYEDTNHIFSSLEHFNFFPHLTKAGMIQGPEGGTEEQAGNIAWYAGGGGGSPDNTNDLFFPTFPFDSLMTIRPDYVTTATHQGMLGHYWWLYKLTAIELGRIDTKFDDGMPRTGSIVVEDQELYYPEPCAVDTDGQHETQEYTSFQNSDCVAYVRAEF